MHVGDETVFWVEVYRCRPHSQCQEFSLVLEALGIEYRVDREDDSYRLLAAPEDASRARAELAEYETESKEWPPPKMDAPQISGRVRDFMGYWIVLLMVYSFEKHQALALNWLDAGKAHAMLIRQGEWWRTVTALTLHADGPHLFNNLLFGSLFGILLANELGTGLTWFSILLAGAAGNGVNAFLHAPNHISIGASTGIFSAIGLLVASQWKHFSHWKQHRLRRWAPPVIGAVLLGYLGTAGERTDVLAHVVGTGSGAMFGLLGNAFPDRLPLTRGWQVLLGCATLVILVLSWVFAFGQTQS